MKEKRGSHIGVVISFVIFIIFVVFLYIIIQPTFSVDTKENLRAYLQNEIIDKTATELTTVSVAINKTNSQSCVELKDFFVGTELSKNIIVRNESGSVLNAKISSNGEELFVEKSDSDVFIKINEASEFAIAQTGSFNPCQQIQEGKTGYTRGLTKTTKIIFSSKIIQLLDDYVSDYDATKDSLNLAPGNEFGFGFKYKNETLIGTEEQGVLANIYVDEIPVRYVNEEAAIESGFLIIRVW